MGLPLHSITQAGAAKLVSALGRTVQGSKWVESLTHSKYKPLISLPQNGVKGFIPAVNKVTLHYDQPRAGAGGNCVNMTQFIKSGQLTEIARIFPFVEMVVQPAPRQPPMMVAVYANGQERRVNCSGWSPTRITRELQVLCEEYGGKARRKYVLPVQPGALGRGAERVTGVWDPFHPSALAGQAQLFRP